MEKPQVTAGSGRHHVSGEIVQSPPWFTVDVPVIADNTPGAWAEIFKGLLAGLNHRGTPIWTEQQFAARNTTGQAVIFFGMPVQAKGRALLSYPGNGAKITADTLGGDRAPAGRAADTLFAVFKHQQRLVAVFLPKTGTTVDTVLHTARKITHYSRYSRLFFKNGTNIGKRIDKASGSPLTHHMEDN
jgi:hypothetical protein